ncbi:MAG TPA: CsgG/HfaB family protein [Methylomirabilota bacterium]|nr:CsgG/HfaB family protein [Methylomirabilota bacterium]
MKSNLGLKWSSVTALTLLTAAMNVFSATSNGAYVPTISVAKTTGTAGPYNPNWQPAMGDGLAQMMVTELGKLGNFRVLESVALEDLREERKLGESGEVAGSKAVTKGGFEAADYMLKTTITRFGAKKSSYGGGGVPVPVPFLGGSRSFSVDSSEHEVQIDWRVVDYQSREVVAQGRGVGKESGKGFHFGSWGGRGYSKSSEFMDSALGKATMKAIADISSQISGVKLTSSKRLLAQEERAEDVKNAKRAALNQLKQTPGEVLLVDGNDIVVSLGTANGFATGDKLVVYKTLKRTNKSGKEIVMNELYGEIELTAVGKAKSHARVKAGLKIEEGWTVADATVAVD